jgi:hypothetical protein
VTKMFGPFEHTNTHTNELQYPSGATPTLG